MLSLSKTFLALCLSFIVYKVIASRIKKRQQNAKAAALGCLSPPVLRSKNWLGNSLLKESLKATKEDRGPQFIRDTMDSISPSCHTVKVPILDYELIVTRDPENVRVLFSSADFDISYTREASWMPLLGRGIFTSRGDVWKHSRALLRPQFAKDMISDLDMEEKHLDNLMSQLPLDTATGWTEKVDLQPLLFRLTLDIVTEFLYGQSVNSLTKVHHGKAGGDDDIAKHFDSAKVWIDKRGAFSKFYWLLNSKEFKEDCSTIHDYVDAIVAERLALAKSEKPAADPEKGARFNLLNELTEATQNPEELRNETLHVLIAGRDTMGCLLGWCMYFLARHPEVYANLRKAVLDQFGDARPEFRGLRDCRYLQWVITETLRVAAVIPLNERRALRDTVLPSGGGPDGKASVFVPEGTQVLIPFFAMQYRTDLWGPDVEEFKPERWEVKRAGWEFIPFGGGARKCLGQQYALTAIGYAIARVCQEYDHIDNMEQGDGRIRMHHAIENRSGTGVQVRLHKAGSPAAETLSGESPI
ncbi:Cytochrome P450 [Pleurostoma richardsiae]|uniref:Cytochrome P450 n=1 Tax=Pleurostoma richardsiae TaxID=41990 RepID=A0AA38RB85_9PEZI|nr:Cytochrome P450 [Pleurostoma richardsiae]